MLTKCKCNHCSTALEFDSANAGTTIPCPACGMETTLYVPRAGAATGGTMQLSKRSKSHPASPFAGRLSVIRSDSCYRTLRAVIDITFTVSKVLVGLAAIVVVFRFFNALANERTGLLDSAGLVPVVLGSLLVIALLHATHQAALLLVDIADCSIRLVVAAENSTALK